MSISAASNDVYSDARSLNGLRHAAHEDPKAALKTVAKKFEALFVNMMMQSMRKANATMDSGLLSNDSTRTYQGMLDSQMSVHLSERGTGLGLADTIVRQLGGDNKPFTPGDGVINDALMQLKIHRMQHQPQLIPRSAVNSEAANLGPSPLINEPISSPREFVERLWPDVRQAADKLGVAPEVLLAQSALETGWGKHVLQHEDGRSSHNLFNIKADQRWPGESVSVNSLEFLSGSQVMQRSDFRSYNSFSSSFKDYVDFLQSSPRYSAALQNVGNPEKFLKSLQDAGYATDPAYADKVGQVLAGSNMKEALTRLQLSSSRGVQTDSEG